MSLDTLRLWLEGTALSERVNWSSWVWPLCECLHFLGFTLLIGTVGLFDLRVLGMARDLPPGTFDRLLRWGVAGFALCLGTGILFFVGIPGGYIDNPAFRLKLLFLALAGSNVLLFSRTVSERVEGLAPGETAPAAARCMAGISLFLWIAVLCAGRMIAFYKP
jgi:hypothetical protein